MVTKFFQELEKNYTYHSPDLVDQITRYAAQIYDRQQALDLDVQMHDGTTRGFPATHLRIQRTRLGVEYARVTTSTLYDSSGNVVYDVTVLKKETEEPMTPPAIDEDVFASLDDAISSETVAGRFDSEFKDLENGRSVLLACLGKEDLYEEDYQS